MIYFEDIIARIESGDIEFTPEDVKRFENIYSIQVDGVTVYRKDIPERSTSGVAKLREIREARGLKIKEFTKLISESGNSGAWECVKSWEDDPIGNDPSCHPEIIERICKVLNVTPQQLSGQEPFDTSCEGRLTFLC
ncbi:MAG: hypothetical protein K0S71_654 [Clostridia bacterium]|jgi:hypothetical protein|nr:hypothetical protein [Clostridia bacterium]